MFDRGIKIDIFGGISRFIWAAYEYLRDYDLGVEPEVSGFFREENISELQKQAAEELRKLSQLIKIGPAQADFDKVLTAQCQEAVHKTLYLGVTSGIRYPGVYSGLLDKYYDPNSAKKEDISEELLRYADVIEGIKPHYGTSDKESFVFMRIGRVCTLYQISPQQIIANMLFELTQKPYFPAFFKNYYEPSNLIKRFGLDKEVSREEFEEYKSAMMQKLNNFYDPLILAATLFPLDGLDE